MFVAMVSRFLSFNLRACVCRVAFILPFALPLRQEILHADPGKIDEGGLRSNGLILLPSFGLYDRMISDQKG